MVTALRSPGSRPACRDGPPGRSRTRGPGGGGNRREVSGGNRSAAGTAANLTLASLFGTWRVRGLNPFDESRRLLATPQF